jgi:hypothetical protein
MLTPSRLRRTMRLEAARCLPFEGRFPSVAKGEKGDSETTTFCPNGIPFALTR